MRLRMQFAMTLANQAEMQKRTLSATREQPI
jgi:hypothetical protein